MKKEENEKKQIVCVCTEGNNKDSEERSCNTQQNQHTGDSNQLC
jgi:hypothetical protein